MAKFIKYLSSAHIGYMNAALYDSGSVRLENVANGKSIAAFRFDSTEKAEDWFASLDENGTNVTRLFALLRRTPRTIN